MKTMLKCVLTYFIKEIDLEKDIQKLEKKSNKSQEDYDYELENGKKAELKAMRKRKKQLKVHHYVLKLDE